MIEKVDTKNKPILTIGGRQFDFESFEFSQQSSVNPFPGANDDSVFDVGAVGKWMDSNKPQTIFTVVVNDAEAIKAIMVMFPSKDAEQKFEVDNLQLSMFLFHPCMVVLADYLALDEKRVRFQFKATELVRVGEVLLIGA